MLRKLAVLVGASLMCSLGAAQTPAWYAGLKEKATPSEQAEWRPTQLQASGIGLWCDAYGQYGRTLFEQRRHGAEKPNVANRIKTAIANEIYANPSSVTNADMAESAGFQLCVPIAKEGLRSGALQVATDGRVIQRGDFPGQ